MIINNNFLEFLLLSQIIFFFPLLTVYPFGVLNCYSSRYHRSAMAEILHIQLKIPLHESKREKEKERENGSRTFIYIYTHHQLTICTYVCRHHCRRTKQTLGQLLFSLSALVKLQSHPISSFSSSPLFFPMILAMLFCK